MSVASMGSEDISGGHIKIGTTSHLVRNVMMVAAVATIGGGIWVFQSSTNKTNAAALTKLETFRAAYAEKCDAPSWRGESAPLVRETYLRSTKLQDTVSKQQTALSGGATCEDVFKALKAADLPMPTPVPNQT